MNQVSGWIRGHADSRRRGSGRSARVRGDFVLLGVYSRQPDTQQQRNDANAKRDMLTPSRCYRAYTRVRSDGRSLQVRRQTGGGGRNPFGATDSRDFAVA